MAMSWLRSSVRRLPPIARRDRQIRRLKRRVHELRDRIASLEADADARAERLRHEFARGPSFQVRINTERRLRALGEAFDTPSTSVIRHGKLHVYDLVRSLGIETPAEYGRWDDPADIQWDDLPDLVVIKSAFGTHGRGVWPLRRREGGWTTIGNDEIIPQETLAAMVAEPYASGVVRGPLVAEEFLDEDGTGRLPTDVKFYAFYGEVPLAVLRRPAAWGAHVSTTVNRIVDARGQDVTELQTRSSIDPTLPVPVNFAEALGQAQKLSTELRAPFSRLDFYCLPSRVVFGEVTPRPGGGAWHGPVIDRMLGDAWDRAEARIARDLARQGQAGLDADA
jgi:hypothetical protein